MKTNASIFLALLPFVLAQTEFNEKGGMINLDPDTPSDCIRTWIRNDSIETYFGWSPSRNQQCWVPDCGGGRAPVKYSVPGCHAYTGTISTITPQGWPVPTDVPAETTTTPQAKPTTTAKPEPTKAPEPVDKGDDKKEEDNKDDEKDKGEDKLEDKPAPVPTTGPTGTTDKPKETVTTEAEDTPAPETTPAPTTAPTRAPTRNPATNETVDTDNEPKDENDEESGAVGRTISWMALAGSGFLAAAALL